jgi:predicted AlkP superfamily pyrophosphatase or phosphodiesterase
MKRAFRARWSLAMLLCATGAGLAQGVAAGTNAPNQRDKPYVILLSFDGIRAEYLQRLDLPNFARVMRAGVRSEGLIPVFPSKTFPNHYSIATGMYVDAHGIVGNSFWDPAKAATYSLGDSLSVRDATWYRGEPIWVTAEKQGMVAASYFWPGSEAPISGVRPSIVKAYDGRVPNARRVDSVLAWLAMPPESRPHMITMYMSDVDGAGHDHGPLSPQVDTAAWAVDVALGRLLDGMDRLPADVRGRVYLVIVSDHGMSETSPRWYAALDTLIDLAGVRIADGGPLANLHVDGGLARAVVLRDSINRRMRHGMAYARGDVPVALHYNTDPRIGDLVVIMDEHFTVGSANRAPRRNGGGHGWDPSLPSMHAAFLVMGPGIPPGKVMSAFENIEIYPYLTELLALPAATPIDGHAGRLAQLIRDAKD